ncbi:RNA 2',3'-cyclic phosphodiesterase [Candidatus Sordicultor fermentans]|uniref:RNA 2',3'-cyclic phosphodiesterase n=1 Tax=Candidatus Sordicultor fermentans TaxID=1953203 RepID=UPI0016910F8D|nr:RNA 2',3'-cyclic phosphodiesterase [Candidatus Atribacteria bacterium]
MRTFLAINLEGSVKEELIGIQEQLKSKMQGIRWVNIQNLHITLKFLGEINADTVALMEYPLRELAGQTTSFRVSLTNLGAFPSFKEPRVVWMGIGEGATELSNLAQGIETALKNVPASFHNREIPQKTNEKFLPHLTIGRRSRKEAFKVDPSIFNKRWECENRINVESFYLIESILRPNGPLYIPRQEFLLKKW